MSTEINESINSWVKYIMKEHSNKTYKDIDKTFRPMSRDIAKMYSGGSGNYSVFYLIDDFIQIRFDFNLDDKLISFSVFPFENGWLKAPDGTLLQGGDSTNQELIII